MHIWTAHQCLADIWLFASLYCHLTSSVSDIWQEFKKVTWDQRWGRLWYTLKKAEINLTVTPQNFLLIVWRKVCAMKRYKKMKNGKSKLQRNSWKQDRIINLIFKDLLSLNVKICSSSSALINIYPTSIPIFCPYPTLRYIILYH